MLPTDGATRWAAGEEAMHSLEDERSRLIIGVGLKNSPIVKQLSKLPTRGSHREARVSLDISRLAYFDKSSPISETRNL